MTTSTTEAQATTQETGTAQEPNATKPQLKASKKATAAPQSPLLCPRRRSRGRRPPSPRKRPKPPRAQRLQSVPSALGRAARPPLSWPYSSGRAAPLSPKSWKLLPGKPIPSAGSSAVLWGRRWICRSCPRSARTEPAFTASPSRITLPTLLPARLRPRRAFPFGAPRLFPTLSEWRVIHPLHASSTE